MNHKEVKLGLVGAGAWGKNYLQTVGTGRVLDVCISSVCTRTPESLGTLGNNYVKTTDFRELVKHKLDGIIVASATDTHFEIAAHLLRNGQNVLIEKPLTQTYGQALKLERIHREKAPRSVVMVGHIQLYDPGYQALKSTLGKIGPIAEMVFQGLQSPVRTDSTVIENWGPHPIYLFEDIVGSRPRSIVAKQTGDDNAHMNIDYDHQIIGRVDIGSVSEKKRRELTVIGQDGSLTLDWSTPKKTLVLATREDTVDVPFATDSSPLELELLEFVTCIRTRTTPRTPLTQGVEVMRVLAAAQESLAQGGRRVDLRAND